MQDKVATPGQLSIPDFYDQQGILSYLVSTQFSVCKISKLVTDQCDYQQVKADLCPELIDLIKDARTTLKKAEDSFSLSDPYLSKVSLLFFLFDDWSDSSSYSSVESQTNFEVHRCQVFSRMSSLPRLRAATCSYQTAVYLLFRRCGGSDGK